LEEKRVYSTLFFHQEKSFQDHSLPGQAGMAVLLTNHEMYEISGAVFAPEISGGQRTPCTVDAGVSPGHKPPDPGPPASAPAQEAERLMPA
jgi:hypothetical protein